MKSVRYEACPRPNKTIGLVSLGLGLVLTAITAFADTTVEYNNQLEENLTIDRANASGKGNNPIYRRRHDTVTVTGNGMLRLTFADSSTIPESQLVGYQSGDWKKVLITLTTTEYSIVYLESNSGNNNPTTNNATTKTTTGSTSLNGQTGTGTGTGSGDAGSSAGSGGGGRAVIDPSRSGSTGTVQTNKNDGDKNSARSRLNELSQRYQQVSTNIDTKPASPEVDRRNELDPMDLGQLTFPQNLAEPKSPAIIKITTPPAATKPIVPTPRTNPATAPKPRGPWDIIAVIVIALGFVAFMLKRYQQKPSAP